MSGESGVPTTDSDQLPTTRTGNKPAVRREGAIAIGATAIGALALGALAIGAVAGIERESRLLAADGLFQVGARLWQRSVLQLRFGKVMKGAA